MQVEVSVIQSDLFINSADPHSVNFFLLLIRPIYLNISDTGLKTSKIDEFSPVFSCK